MKVIMYGWEFPPVKTGGLGTACYGLTKGLAKQGVTITFVVPFDPRSMSSPHVKLLGPEVRVCKQHSVLSPYASATVYEQRRKHLPINAEYGRHLFEEVDRYAALVSEYMDDSYDIIHVHDWMTYAAGMLAKKKVHRPLIAHIHATEYDRTAGNPNPEIARREQEGLLAADRVIANSNRLKQEVVSFYGVDPEKVRVVHWGLDQDDRGYALKKVSPWKKTVLFLGRVTVQKGPDYFLQLAQKVLKERADVHFVVVGTGDLLPQMIDSAIDARLITSMAFTGALSGEDVHRAFKTADVFVMPSVSEPFGLVALEAMRHGTPCILSKQSGVSEVVHNCFFADFWDIDRMANLILSALQYPQVMHEISKHASNEAKRLTLDVPAAKIIKVYDEVRL